VEISKKGRIEKDIDDFRFPVSVKKGWTIPGGMQYMTIFLRVKR
jgi:hypothetical protein